VTVSTVTQISVLQESIKDEKKKRKRQQPLFKTLALPEDGLAIIYNPSKVQQARNILRAQEEEKQRIANAKEDV
jgi:hypothetical protein